MRQHTQNFTTTELRNLPRHYVLTPWTRDGRVVADSVTIAAEIGGRIVEIRVRENEYVKKGDVLFRVDPASYKAALDNAKATVASTLATMEMRRSNAARGHKLSRLSISAEEQEDLDLAAKTAEANYQQAQAVCENAQINLERTVVHAPVNGYITNLVLDVGDYADVRIKLIDVPKDTILSSGMTVTVSIIQETNSKKERLAEIQ
jgi:RND family efflux transporter MFP subunit